MLYLLSAALVSAAPVQSDGCTSVSACAFFVNHGDGPGLGSYSASGQGLVGRTSASDGNRKSFVAGVFGEASSTAEGPFAGVYGRSDSPDGFGVIGQGYAGTIGLGNVGAIGMGQMAGVFGVASRSVGKNSGVYGYGPNGVLGFGLGPSPGVFGIDFGSSTDSYGVEGLATSPAAAGLHGQGPTAIIATSTAQYGGVALQLEPQNDSLALAAFDPAGHRSATLDAHGNLTLAGELSLAGAARSTSTASSGAQYTTYGDRSAQPLIEDVGEARLSRGVASVPLEPTFASLMDRSKSYMVFVTPEDDSKGLYVERRATGGFVVRENGNGTSTLTFQYRVVARPSDTPDRRLPFARGVTRVPGFVRHVTVPNVSPPNVSLPGTGFGK